MHKFESYRVPDSCLMSTTSGIQLPALPELSEKIKGKLRYFAEETPESQSLPSAEEAVRSVFAAEGRNPDECARLLEVLGEYEVVYPNMFLTENISDSMTNTSFNPRGEASARLETMAARIVQSIKESRDAKYDPEVTGLDYDALTNYVYDHLQSVLAGPFASIQDIAGDKPIMILNDMSYTSQQMFRAFSGVYCDFTPMLDVSKADFLEYTVHHELAHKKTEEIAAAGLTNIYLPGIDLGIDQDAISHANLNESIADAYAILKHIQHTGSTLFPEQIATMRTLEVFSRTFKNFETNFTLKFGNSPRKRSEVEHFTAPVLDALIPRAKNLYETGKLQEMSDKELIALAIECAREMKISGDGLAELSKFVTSLNFNTLRENLPGVIPQHKDSISPDIVQWVLDCVEQTGSYEPRGGNSLELRFVSIGQDQTEHISDELRAVFAHYRKATGYLRENGITPFSEQATDYLLSDLFATLNLPSNQTPNATVARELNDSWASMDKYAPFCGGSFDLVGVRKMLEHCGVQVSDRSFERAVKYRRTIGDQPRTGDLILKMFAE